MSLNKYQFFITGEVDGTNFTYLDMEAKDFQSNKNALLAQGLFVDGEAILAKSGTEAVEEYKQQHQKVLKGNIAPMHPFYTFFAMLGKKFSNTK